MIVTVCLLCFEFFPVSGAELRPDLAKVEASPFVMWGLRLNYGLDPAVNLFPSLHLAGAGIAAMSAGRARRSYGWLGGTAVRRDVSASALMDALYLVLHNAGRFGNGAKVDLTVEESDGRARIVVRDRGSGFSEEAFSRAFDPFYSTSDAGLGLGLPHARKVIESMGGSIELRNVPDGGAEVEISF